MKRRTSPSSKPEVKLCRSGRHLENRWHNSANNFPIYKKCGILMQNSMPVMVIWTKLKPKVEFQYGGRSFFQTGNSYVTDVDWVIWTKFDLLIDIDLQKRVASIYPKPEVKFRCTGRRQNRYNVLTPLRMVRLWSNLTAWWTLITAKLKRGEEFQCGGHLFLQSGNVIPQPRWFSSSSSLLSIHHHYIFACNS